MESSTKTPNVGGCGGLGASRRTPSKLWRRSLENGPGALALGLAGWTGPARLRSVWGVVARRRTSSQERPNNKKIKKGAPLAAAPSRFQEESGGGFGWGRRTAVAQVRGSRSPPNPARRPPAVSGERRAGDLPLPSRKLGKSSVCKTSGEEHAKGGKISSLTDVWVYSLW